MRCQADVAEWQSHQRPRRQPSLRPCGTRTATRLGDSHALLLFVPHLCVTAPHRGTVPRRQFRFVMSGKNVIVLFGSQCTCTVSLSFIATRVYMSSAEAREVCIRSVPRYPHSLPSPVRNPGKRPPASGLHGWVRPLCTFRLMLTPPSRSSPRWRWHALSEALEETSCRGWHLRDSKPQAAARLSCRGGRTVSYRVR